MKEFLKNNLFSLVVVISLICVSAVFAGNVILQEGDVDVDGNITVKRLGIGVTASTFQLEIEGDSAVGKIKRYNEADPAWGPGLLFIRARGIQSVPLDINVSDWAGRITFRGLISAVETNIGAFGFILTDKTNKIGDYVFTDNLAVPTSMINNQGIFLLKDGVTAPSTRSGFAQIYVDSSDGDLKVKFGDGTVKTIVTDS